MHVLAGPVESLRDLFHWIGNWWISIPVGLLIFWAFFKLNKWLDTPSRPEPGLDDDLAKLEEEIWAEKEAEQKGAKPNFCSSCGQKVTDAVAKFCAGCGKALS